MQRFKAGLVSVLAVGVLGIASFWYFQPIVETFTGKKDAPAVSIPEPVKQPIKEVVEQPKAEAAESYKPNQLAPQPPPTTQVDPGPAPAATCPITTCNDGSCSESRGRGTCSHHDGVASYN